MGVKFLFKFKFQELNVFHESIQALKMAKGKYAGSKEAVEAFDPDYKDHPVLVPLTSSMYVPGIIKKVDNVVIDIGTGYYAEKDLTSAKDYFKRKIEFVSEQLEKIETFGNEKSKIRDAIIDVMEIKIRGIQAGA